ncbi:NUDIX domain-containing protein [Streptomyces sp. NPDC058231]|uniref:NUDIX domain-containing protein n=1 Tax=Streptomyces sp. NPDC058231 TaxID=3346392 RepID=UPI0036E5125D
MNRKTLADRPPAAEPRGAVVIIVNGRDDLLLHLRDDIQGIAWPGHWSLLGGSCEPGEIPAQTIVRELNEEVGLALDDMTELFDIHDPSNANKILTVFAASWDGDETTLELTEGVKLQFFSPEDLPVSNIPPCIRDGIYRFLNAQLGT